MLSPQFAHLLEGGRLACWQARLGHLHHALILDLLGPILFSGCGDTLVAGHEPARGPSRQIGSRPTALVVDLDQAHLLELEPRGDVEAVQALGKARIGVREDVSHGPADAALEHIDVDAARGALGRVASEALANQAFLNLGHLCVDRSEVLGAGPRSIRKIGELPLEPDTSGGIEARHALVVASCRPRCWLGLPRLGGHQEHRVDVGAREGARGKLDHGQAHLIETAPHGDRAIV